MNHCLLCKYGRLKLLFRAGIYDISQCGHCHQVQTVHHKNSIRKQLYDDTDIQIYIKKEEEFRKLFRNTLHFMKKFIQSGVLVDIGAGVGLLVDEAKNAGFEAHGFEPSKESVKTAKKLFNIKLINSEFFHYNADVIIINHVLEHIQEPHRLLVKIKKSINSDGFLFVGVPNFGCFLAQHKYAKWQSLIPDQHRWHFTKYTLDKIIIPYGFRRVGLDTDSHDRSIHPFWKRPLYFILDTITHITKNGEAILVAYKKL